MQSESNHHQSASLKLSLWLIIFIKGERLVRMGNEPDLKVMYEDEEELGGPHTYEAV
jgi:hypothetical protein